MHMPSISIRAFAFLAALTPASAWAEAYTLPFISEEGAPVAQCRSGYALSSLRCARSYCDNIQATCTAYDAPPARRSTQAPYWTAWFSEEKKADVIDGSNFPRLANAYSIAIGLQCRGRYCDDLRLLMLPMSGAGVPTLDSKAEFPLCRRSIRFSEEQRFPPQPAPPQGKSMEFIRRVGCSGAYCDNLQIEWCKVFHSGWNW